MFGIDPPICYYSRPWRFTSMRVHIRRVSMNTIQIPQKTMSSIEIAELLGSRHDSVKRTIEIAKRFDK